MGNKNKYIIERALRVINGVFSSIYYSFLNTKRTKTIIFNSACNQEFTWNAKSLFLNGKEKFNGLGYRTYFVIDDDDKRNNLIKEHGPFFITTKNKYEHKIILQSAVWVLSTLETPSSGIFLNRNRFVYHLGHGTPIKNIGLMERNVSVAKRIFYFINKTNISVYLSTSQYFRNYMAKAFGVNQKRIVVAPQPRIDDFILNKNQKGINKIEGVKYILYAPTWRHYSDTRLFPFSDFNLTKLSQRLKNMNVVILIRLHPRFENESKDYLCENVMSLNSSICPDVSEVLNEIDALVTDYSSIYCDYLILNKPVAFIPYDQSEYEKEIGFSTDYDSITTSVKLRTQEQFLNFIERIEAFDCEKEQSILASKINFLPSNVSATEYNIEFINEEYNKRWSM